MKQNSKTIFTKGKRNFLPYNPHLKELARQLRNNSTPGEIALWKVLRNKQLLGFDFHRQKPMLNYIVDFYCNELYLAIEIDGEYHSSEKQSKKDKQKDEELNEYNVTVLRFSEKEAYKSTNTVASVIQDWIEENHSEKIKTS